MRENQDVFPDRNGQIFPGKGGMSIAPDDPTNLQPHRLPVEFDGKNKTDKLWRIYEDELPEGLNVDFDKRGHGNLQPAEPMDLETYRRLLRETIDKWVKQVK